MADFSYRIIHFRFLNGDANNPISMHEFRALREEVHLANVALIGESSLRLENPELSPYGGYTVALITDNNRNQKWLGIAKCSPDDRFVRRVGVELAVELAEKAMESNEADDPFAFVRGRVDRRLVQYLVNNDLVPAN